MYKLARQTWILAFLLYGIGVAIMPEGGEPYDLACWAQWADYIRLHGLGLAYGSGTNYLPGHLYELKLHSLLFSSAEALQAHMHYLKYFSLLFDIGGALLVCSLAAGMRSQVMMLLAYLLNVAYLHNTVLWGQFDSVFSALTFAAFLAAYTKRFFLSTVLYLVSLNFKLQAIIFFPPLMLLLLYRSGPDIRWKKLGAGFLALCFLQSIILLPFILESQAIRVWQVLQGLGGGYGYVSLKASNAWHWLQDGGDLRWMSDQVETFGMSLKRWGLLMVAVSYAAILFPLARAVFFQWRGRSVDLRLPRLLAIFSLSVLVFFYFNTQMHERYTFPAFYYTGALALVTRNGWPFGIFSLAYFLNNERCLHFFRFLDIESGIFDFRFSSLLYFLLIVMLFYRLYRIERLPQSPGSIR